MPTASKVSDYIAVYFTHFCQNVKNYGIIRGMRNVGRIGGRLREEAAGAGAEGNAPLKPQASQSHPQTDTAQPAALKGLNRGFHGFHGLETGWAGVAVTLYETIARFQEGFCHRSTRMDTDGMVLLICVYLRESVAQFIFGCGWPRLPSVVKIFITIIINLVNIAILALGRQV